MQLIGEDTHGGGSDLGLTSEIECISQSTVRIEMNSVTSDVLQKVTVASLLILCDCISFKITFYIYVCVNAQTNGKYVEDREQFVGIGSLLFFTMWVPGIKLRSSVLVTSTFQSPSPLPRPVYALYF